MKKALKYLLILLAFGSLVYFLLISIYGQKYERTPLIINSNCDFNVNVKINYDIPWWPWDRVKPFPVIPGTPQTIPEDFKYKLEKIYIIVPRNDYHDEYELNIIPEGYQGGKAEVKFIYNRTNIDTTYLQCTIDNYSQTDGIRAVQMESTDAKK
ncbi:MAG: hypothetical protein WAT71_08015 [Ignavibacteria bacterium]